MRILAPAVGGKGELAHVVFNSILLEILLGLAHPGHLRVSVDHLKTTGMKVKRKVPTVPTLYTRILQISVSVPDPVGSGFKLPGWIQIRIRIRNPYPESGIEL